MMNNLVVIEKVKNKKFYSAENDWLIIYLLVCLQHEFFPVSLFKLYCLYIILAENFDLCL